MKNFIFAVVVALVLLIFCTSCGWKVEIVDPTKPVESEETFESEEPVEEELTPQQERADKYLFEYEFNYNTWMEELEKRGISVSFEERKYTGNETFEANIVFKNSKTELSIPFSGIYYYTGTIYYGTVLFTDNKTAVFCGNGKAVFFDTETLEIWDFEPELPDYGKENIWVNGAGINDKTGEIYLFVTPLDTFKLEEATTKMLVFDKNGSFTEQDLSNLRGTSKNGEKYCPFFFRKSAYFEYEGKPFFDLGYELLEVENASVWEQSSDLISAENDEHRLEMFLVYPKGSDAKGQYLALLYKNGEVINSMMFSEPDFCDPNYSGDEDGEKATIAVKGDILTYRFDPFAMTLILDFKNKTHSLEYSPDDIIIDMEQKPITSPDGKYSIYTFGYYGAGDIIYEHLSLRNNDTGNHEYIGKIGGMYGGNGGVGFLKNSDYYIFNEHSLKIFDPLTFETKFDINKNFPLGYDSETDSERGILTFRRNPEDFSYIVVYYEYENGYTYGNKKINDTFSYECLIDCNYKIGFLDSEGNLIESYDSEISIVTGSFGLEEVNMFYSEEKLTLFVSDRRGNSIFSIIFDMKTKEFTVS